MPASFRSESTLLGCKQKGKINLKLNCVTYTYTCEATMHKHVIKTQLNSKTQRLRTDLDRSNNILHGRG